MVNVKELYHDLGEALKKNGDLQAEIKALEIRENNLRQVCEGLEKTNAQLKIQSERCLESARQEASRIVNDANMAASRIKNEAHGYLEEAKKLRTISSGDKAKIDDLLRDLKIREALIQEKESALAELQKFIKTIVD